MKLTAKLVFILVLGIIAVLLVDSYITFRRQARAFEEDMKLDAHLIGMIMKSLVSDAWHMYGQKNALELVANANDLDQSVEIRWVWLNAPPEDVYAPGAPRKKISLLAHGQEVSFRALNKEGDEVLFTYIPIEVDEKQMGALELSQSLSWLDEHIHRAFIKSSILVAVLILLSAFAVPLLGFKMVGQPLRQMVEKMRRIGKGDFSAPLHLSGHDELSELAVGLNTMCEELQEAWHKARVETEARIAALEQLRHEDRLKTVGRLASGIAHELGTPLNVISGRAGLIAKDPLSIEATKENAGIIKTQSERITTIIRHLLDFARRRTTQRNLVDLRKIIRQVLDLMSPLGQKQKVDFCLVGEDIPVMANVDTEQIQQVLMNIITNSLQAMTRGGNVKVGIRCEHACPPEGHEGHEGEYLCIYVQDEGQGISEENIGHIFEPFFTTKGTGKGTGLGLSIAYGIVREHGGWINVMSELGKGSCFTIFLPQEDN